LWLIVFRFDNFQKVVKSCRFVARVRDKSGALFERGIFLAALKKAGTDSPTRSF